MNEQVMENIERFFETRSVQFGDVPRLNNIRRWPFWLPLIPEPPQDNDLFPAQLTQSLTGLGWPIAPGTFRDIPLQTDQDSHYHIVNHKLTAFRGPLTGRIACAADAVNVVGVATLFTTELQLGDVICVIDDNNEARFGIVETIANNLALTLEAPFGPNAVTGAAATGLPARFRLGNQWYEHQQLEMDTTNLPLTGTITSAPGNATLTGVGTLFLAEVAAGDTIYWKVDIDGVPPVGGPNGYGIAKGTVLAVVNNTTITLTQPASSTASGGANNLGYVQTATPVVPAVGGITHLSGGIQVAGVNITGINTQFETQLTLGSTICYVDDTGAVNYGIIDTIVNDTTATLTAAGGAVAGVNGVAFKLGALPRTVMKKRFRPLTNYLNTSMIIKSNRDTYLLGGSAELIGASVYSPPSLGAAAGGMIERPHAQRSLQGNRDGLGMLYTPFQMPRDGVLFLRVHNSHNLYTLYVNGAVFGYKVAV